MKKDVIISIHGTQQYSGERPDRIELVTEGTLARDKGGYVISYAESELTGMAGTHTTLSVEPERVTLLRTGNTCAQMVFEPGRTHRSLYDTPYGSMEIGINTSRLSSTLSEQGGNLEIAYSIEVNHDLAGENLFRIQVRELAQ